MTRRSCQGRAFTLLELLVVIGIIALLATLGVGALRGFTAVNVVKAGNRQLLDDINRARNTAQNERTTVYMVFVPPLNTFPVNNLKNVQQKEALTNRFYGQYASYNFIAFRKPGDQPGRGRVRYLSEWKSLPNGVYFSSNEFGPKLTKAQWASAAALANNVSPNKPDLPFMYLDPVSILGKGIPFPTATSPLTTNFIPCIAFDYRGALVGPDPTDPAVPRNVDEIITLTRGSMVLPLNANEQPQFNQLPELIETPRGNSTNNPFIRIDWITGRPRLEEPKA